MAQNVSLHALLESHDTSHDQSRDRMRDKDTSAASSSKEHERVEVLERKLCFEQYHWNVMYSNPFLSN